MKKLITPLLLILIHCSISNAQTWDSLGAGTNGVVRALTVYNNNLQAGGIFGTAGNIPTALVASWDGTKWDSLASGFDIARPTAPSIYCLSDYNGLLYAGGHFSGVDNIPAWVMGIASWNGNVWDSVGGGAGPGSVYALTVFNGELYAGPFYSLHPRIGGIAKWNGTSWDSVGARSGIIGTVYSLAVYNGELYVGGNFTTAGHTSASNIARWNGTSWNTVGSGINVNGTVYSLAVYNGNLYAGGYFDIAGGVNVNNIAQWNGGVWSQVGAGIDSTVDALCVYGSILCAGGSFDSAGGISANNIAYWDGATWDSLGAGINGTVYALCNYSGELCAGGLFTKAGNINANNIARWRSPLSVNTLRTFNNFKIFPNPTTGQFTLSLSNVGGKCNVEIYNVMGESVLNETLRFTQGDKVIDLGSQPNGIYFYRVISEEGSLLGSGKVVIEK